MTGFLIRPDWHLPESAADSESAYLNRRDTLKKLGLGALTAAGLVSALHCRGDAPLARGRAAAIHYDKEFLKGRFPAERNAAFQTVPGRSITDEKLAAVYNNYYEFSSAKNRVWALARDFPVRPWTLEVAGPARRAGVYDVEKLLRRFAQEERVYRMRCVEAWSMVVPWTGIPLGRLIKWLEPDSSAKYVRFVSFHNPARARGQNSRLYRWPYYEGLRMDEAMHDLTLLCTGMYGHPLNKQNGAPIRLIVPWKYGYKSAKGIVRIEFLESRPPTFWNDAAPREYDFLSNVDPAVPHPRWSQASEQPLSGGPRIKTLPFNGYASRVAQLYK